MLLPARAGMIPLSFHFVLPSITAPRTRGDDPGLKTASEGFRRCSPHARG